MIFTEQQMYLKSHPLKIYALNNIIGDFLLQVIPYPVFINHRIKTHFLISLISLQLILEVQKHFNFHILYNKTKSIALLKL